MNQKTLKEVFFNARTCINFLRISTAAAFVILAAIFLFSCGKEVMKDQAGPSSPLSIGIESTYPADLSDSVEINPTIEAKFKSGTIPTIVSSSKILLKLDSTLIPGVLTYSGSTATFIPVADLLPDRRYVVIIKINSMKSYDSDDNRNKEYSWSFRTGRKRHHNAPSVVSVFPLNNASSVDVNVQPKVKFSEEMESSTLNTTTFTLSRGTAVVEGKVTSDDERATFKPNSPLSPNTLYTATITTGVKDEHGIAMKNNYVWNFTTAGSTNDTTAPAVLSSVPSNNATGVGISTKPELTFSETMDASSISAANFILKQGTTPVAGTVSYSGTKATFTPSAPFTANTVYTGSISGAKDVAGNSIAAYTWSFTTAASTPSDVTAPTVVSAVPENNATGVAISSKPAVTFSEAMSASSISAETFTIKQGTTLVAGSVTYSGNTATFTPANPLNAGSVYTGTITTGAKDAAGNAIAANYSWSFTTAATVDATPPTISSVVPSNSATGIATSSKVTANFSEAMNASTISSSFTLKQGSAAVAGTVAYSGTAAVFTPSGALAANTVYTATITTGAKDAAGNAIAANFSWSFTTAAPVDATAPSISSVTPANNTTGIATSSKVTATFSEAMNSSTITTSTFTVKEGTTTVSGTITMSGNTATFTPSAALASGVVYTATITTGAKDAAGNAIASNYSWSFTTAAALVSWSTQVWPIIQGKCTPCHGLSGGSGGVNMGSYSQVAAMSDSKIDNSGMYSKLGVTAAEQAIIKAWIAQGKLNN